VSTDTGISVRIRGIYSTALTKLLLDKGFKISQPSPKIVERFKLEKTYEDFDVEVFDKRDKHGVVVVGSRVEAVKMIFEETFIDVSFRRLPYQLYGVYKGIVVNKNRGHIYVDIGSAIGVLPLNEAKHLEIGDDILVQVKKHGMLPYLSTTITIPGNYAVLIPKPPGMQKHVKISRKIRDQKERERLRILGLSIDLGEWGILWRTAAAYKNWQVLKREITALLKLSKKIKNAQRISAPAKLLDGRNIYEIEFGGASKRKLDEIRNKVVPTLVGHHSLKARDVELSFAVEIAESILSKLPAQRSKIREGFFEALVNMRGPKKGWLFSIEHVKLDGQKYRIGPGEIQEVSLSPVRVVFRRNLKPGHLYDGLDLPVEPGDYAITEIEENKWWFVHKYYDRDSNIKGEYYNINTPIEVYPDGARYVDLEVDIIKWPDGTKEIIDKEKLKEYYEDGTISEKLYRAVLRIAHEVYEKI